MLSESVLETLRNNIFAEQIKQQKLINSYNKQINLLATNLESLTFSLRQNFPTSQIPIMCRLPSQYDISDSEDRLPYEYHPLEEAYEVLNGQSQLGRRAFEYCQIFQADSTLITGSEAKISKDYLSNYYKLFHYQPVRLTELTDYQLHLWKEFQNDINTILTFCYESNVLGKNQTFEFSKTILGREIKGKLALDISNKKFRYYYFSEGENCYIDATDNCVIPDLIKPMHLQLITEFENTGYSLYPFKSLENNELIKSKITNQLFDQLNTWMQSYSASHKAYSQLKVYVDHLRDTFKIQDIKNKVNYHFSISPLNDKKLFTLTIETFSRSGSCCFSTDFETGELKYQLLASSFCLIQQHMLKSLEELFSLLEIPMEADHD